MRTVVLVHGAWHGAWCYAKVVAGLEQRGVPVVAIDLPGHGADTGSSGDLTADARRIRDAASSVAGADGVVLVGHSYGGVVIGEAASDSGTAARVARLVYLCAFAPDAGESLADLARQEPAPDVNAVRRRIDDRTSALDTSSLEAVKMAFYGDCDDDDVRAAAARVCPQPMFNFKQPVSGAPWRSIPTTYVACTDDRAIPIALQWRMATRITEANPAGRIVAWASSHSPFLSRPDRVAALCQQLAQA